MSNTTATPTLPVKSPAEMIGALTGVLGSVLLALNNEYSALAWPTWLISNLCLISFMHRETHFATMLMHCCYLLTTLVGIYQWWIAPYIQFSI